MPRGSSEGDVTIGDILRDPVVGGGVLKALFEGVSPQQIIQSLCGEPGESTEQHWERVLRLDGHEVIGSEEGVSSLQAEAARLNGHEHAMPVDNSGRVISDATLSALVDPGAAMVVREEGLRLSEVNLSNLFGGYGFGDEWGNDQ